MRATRYKTKTKAEEGELCLILNKSTSILNRRLALFRGGGFPVSTPVLVRRTSAHTTAYWSIDSIGAFGVWGILVHFM
jgi:hypothetical protein